MTRRRKRRNVLKSTKPNLWLCIKLKGLKLKYISCDLFCAFKHNFCTKVLAHHIISILLSCILMPIHKYLRKLENNTCFHNLKLALTSPTSSGRSVGIVRLRTKATEFVFFLLASTTAWIISSCFLLYTHFLKN
jgi:hypothetical protein